MSLATTLRSIRRHAPSGTLREPFATIGYAAERLLFGRDLAALMRLHDTDKDTLHRYAEHYTRHFAPWRKRPVTMLEIGIGGYGDPRSGGGSLRMWRTYFPKGRIFGIDIHDKSFHDERRIRTFRGDQADPEFLASVLAETGPPDIVIDDGSHISRDVIASFQYLFPRMADTGIYVVEDLQTSYWPAWPGHGGKPYDPDSHEVAIGYFKYLIHGLNYEERPSAVNVGPPTYLDRNVRGISFYHNLVFIQKGPNQEGGRYRAAAEAS